MPLPGADREPRFTPSGAEIKPQDAVTELKPARPRAESASPSPRPESASPSASPSSPTVDPLAEYPTAPMTEPPLREDGTPFVVERYKRPGASPLDLLPKNVREQIDAATEAAAAAAKASYDAAKRNKRTTAAIGAVVLAGGLYLAFRRK